MQCVNCGFQNMPGSEACGRCRTSLGLATAVMDVNPPRADAMTKQLRRVLPVRKVYYRTRDAMQLDGVATRARHVASRLPSFPLFVRLIAPGWSHFFLKQPIRGHLFLWIFVTCLVPTFLCFGSTSGSIWLGMAFSVHSSAVLNIVTQTYSDAGVRDRIGRSFIVSIALWLVLYWPAIWLVGEFAQPHTVQTALAPFNAGDVILVNRWGEPKRGDIVLYAINYSPENIPAHLAGHGHVYFRYEGENIDRILAVPGDHVQCAAGRLLINGSPSPWRPLNPRPVPRKLDFAMPPNRYFILPSGAPGVAALEDAGLWQNPTSNVSRADIAGRAYLQSHPLSKVHLIR